MVTRSRARVESQNEARATLRNLRISPIKLNMLAEQIRRLKVEEARRVLEYSRKRAAGPVSKLLMSAVANATNNKDLDPDKLVISEAFVGKGLVMKRSKPRARGRSSRIIKPFANMTIILQEQSSSVEVS